MGIVINIELSKYSRSQLHNFVIEGIISVKEYYDELFRRSALNDVEQKRDTEKTESM